MLERREKEEEDARAGVESGKEDPLSLFIREWIDGMRENQGDRKNDYVATWTPRFSGGPLR